MNEEVWGGAGRGVSLGHCRESFDMLPSIRPDWASGLLRASGCLDSRGEPACPERSGRVEPRVKQGGFGSGGRIGVLRHLPCERRGRFQTCPYAIPRSPRAGYKPAPTRGDSRGEPTCLERSGRGRTTGQQGGWVRRAHCGTPAPSVRT